MLSTILAPFRAILSGCQDHAASHRDCPTSKFSDKLATDGPVYRLASVTSAIFVATHVSNLKVVEEELRQSEKRYRTLVEHAPEAIISPMYRNLRGIRRNPYPSGPNTKLRIRVERCLRRAGDELSESHTILRQPGRYHRVAGRRFGRVLPDRASASLTGV